MPAGYLHDTERAREDAVRRYPCPSCGAPARAPCRGQPNRDGVIKGTAIAHTSRYRIGIQHGVVPPMVGRDA